MVALRQPVAPASRALSREPTEKAASGPSRSGALNRGTRMISHPKNRYTPTIC